MINLTLRELRTLFNFCKRSTAEMVNFLEIENNYTAFAKESIIGDIQTMKKLEDEYKKIVEKRK